MSDASEDNEPVVVTKCRSEPNGRAVPSKGDTWKHYKDQLHTYRIIDIGYMEAKPSDVYVLYQRTEGKQPVWLRPLAEFMSVVPFEGRFIYRFELVTRGVTE